MNTTTNSNNKNKTKKDIDTLNPPKKKKKKWGGGSSQTRQLSCAKPLPRNVLSVSHFFWPELYAVTALFLVASASDSAASLCLFAKRQFCLLKTCTPDINNVLRCYIWRLATMPRYQEQDSHFVVTVDVLFEARCEVLFSSWSVLFGLFLCCWF